MRLIDADSCIESIKNLLTNGATVEQAVDAQPTAYNVDKVLHEINTLQEWIFYDGRGTLVNVLRVKEKIKEGFNE